MKVRNSIAFGAVLLAVPNVAGVPQLHGLTSSIADGIELHAGGGVGAVERRDEDVSNKRRALETVTQDCVDESFLMEGNMQGDIQRYLDAVTLPDSCTEIDDNNHIECSYTVSDEAIEELEQACINIGGQPTKVGQTEVNCVGSGSGIEFTLDLEFNQEAGCAAQSCGNVTDGVVVFGDYVTYLETAIKEQFKLSNFTCTSTTESAAFGVSSSLALGWAAAFTALAALAGYIF